MEKHKETFHINFIIGNYLDEERFYEWREILNFSIWEESVPFMPAPNDLIDFSELLEEDETSKLVKEFGSFVFEVTRRKFNIDKDGGNWDVYIKPFL